MIIKNKLINGKYPDTIPNYRKISEAMDFEGPIRRYYDWPSIHEKPMAHQVDTADFLLKHRRGYCFNAIGTGKTLCMDWMIDFLQREKEVKKALIVAPLSTLHSVHGDELKWSLPHLDYAILHGSRRQRLDALKKDRQVYIINFDGLKVLWDDLHKRADIDCVFIDELAILRNKQTELWGVANSLFGPQTDKLVWGFTGSPMPKAPTDCYGQALLINPDRLPQKHNYRTGKDSPIAFYRFREMVMDKWGDWTYTAKPGWEKICYGILQPAIRFTRDECLDLPDCVTETLDVELTKEQRKAYKDMLDQLYIETRDGSVIEAVNEGVKLIKLVQITSGAIYDGSGKIHKFDYKDRLKVLKEQIDSAPDHVLVFAPFRSALKPLAAELRKSYGDGSAEIVDSSVSETKRSQIYTKFTQGDLRFIVAIPDCMSHGLNLQHKCSTIIWWAPISRYDVYEQACGRIIRSGQTKKQLIIHLQGSPVERAMYKKLKNKENAQKILLNLIQERRV